MTLVFTAVWWVMLFCIACSAAVTVVALGIYFHDLLAHSEGEQEGRAAAGRPPNQLVAARALGNAKNMGAPEVEDKFRRSLFLDWVADDRPLLTLVQQTDGRHLYVHRRTLDTTSGPVFLDGDRVTPGTEKCLCDMTCEFPCWQRIGLTAQACCPGCPALPDPDDDLAAAPGDDTPDAA